LASKVGTPDYTELALPGGHVGVFVGNRSQAMFAPAVATFVGQHDQPAA
jgi:polyhydroxyalkanoate synthase